MLYDAADGKAATLLSIVAGVVLYAGGRYLIIGYDLDVSLGVFKQLKLVSVRRSFKIETDLSNELESVLDCT